MSSVGEKLKKAREKKHLSVEQVSEKTRIHSKILEAIEEDRVHHYLSKVYIRGFLKSYARLVGLSEEDVMQEYPLEAAQSPPLSVPNTLDRSSWEEERGVTPWVGRLLLLILVVGAIFIIGVGLSKMRGEKKISLSPSTIHHTVNRKPSTALQRGAVIPYPFRIPQGELLKLKLRAIENTWITVSADDHLLYQGLLTKGREEIWTAKQSFELSVSDGGAVSFGLNKKSLGIPGEKGRPLEELVMTREGWGKRERE